MEVLKLTADDSKVAKGGAVLLLLWFHLFYLHPEYGWFVHYTSRKSHICVAMFMILSGYGLSAIFKHEQNVFKFYYRRLSKLYATYWFIFVACVPISMMLTGVTVESSYPSVTHPNLAFIFQFFGLHMYYGGYGFNPTWWFMSAIILLYILFPFFYVTIEKYSWWPLVVCLIFTTFLRIDIPVLKPWIYPFIIGIFLEKWNVHKDNLCNKIISNIPKLLFIASIFILFLFFLKKYVGEFSLLKVYYHTKILMAVIAIFFFVYIARVFSIISKILHIFGEYSYVIFLTHTFLYYLWFPKLFYTLKYPLLIMISLTICSLIFAIILTKIQLIVTSISKFAIGKIRVS